MPKASSSEGAARTRSAAGTASRQESAAQKTRLDLFQFVPFRLNRLAAEVSSALSGEYQERYGLDIPEWRVLATLGFRNDACSAQYIAHCTRTHKSTISRAVTALMKRQMVERVENADDRREFRLRMTRKGKALYEELIPRLLRKEQEILSCLSAQERKEFALLLGKIEKASIWCRPARRRMRRRRIRPAPSLAGLVPTIHACCLGRFNERWMDARHKRRA